MGVLSQSLFIRLIAVCTLQDCLGKKPSFEEKTRFQGILFHSKWILKRALDALFITSFLGCILPCF